MIGWLCQRDTQNIPKLSVDESFDELMFDEIFIEMFDVCLESFRNHRGISCMFLWFMLVDL